MKKISRQAAHKKALGNVLASLRIEHLSPSAVVVSRLKACAEGKDTTSHVLEEVMRRHVTLRRV